MVNNVQPRGIRNNNPGNIRKGQSWQGLAKDQTDTNFDQFISPEYGIRAIVKIIISYQSRGMNTVRKIINTWAPPNENNTDAYVKSVANSIGIGTDDPIIFKKVTDWNKLVKAIITHENGQQPYTDDIINAGINMAIS